MKLVIIDYGSGNLHSAKKAFERAASELGNNAEIIVSCNTVDVKNADKIVLPGVGAFGDCYNGLSAIAGMVDELREQVLQNKKQFLGICVGMQLLSEVGNENGSHKGLGWFENSSVDKISPTDTSLKIPHMGWNNLEITKTDAPIFKNIPQSSDVYFVHSYQVKCPEQYSIAHTNYGGKINAVIQKDNITGFQFHPEKSQKTGIELIKNFIQI